MDKYSNGAFLFFRTGAQCVPLTPLEVEARATQHGIAQTIVPAYAGDRQAVSRAISQVSAHLSRQGWLLRPITQTRHKVVYGIVREEKNQVSETLDHNHSDNLEWCDEHHNGHYVHGTHEIARRVDSAYQELRGKIVSGDWSETITHYLIDICLAQAIRDDGRVYWVAPAHLTAVRQLQPFLESVGISLVVCEVESEAKTVVQQAAQEGLAAQLQTLQDEIAAFDGQQKPTTYRLRVEALQALRKRATVYSSTLGIATDQVQAMVDQLERTTQDMLHVRELTVVHKSGSSPGGTAHRSRETAAECMARQPVATTPLQDSTPMAPGIAWNQTGFTW